MTRTIQTAGARVAYETFGMSGPPIVALPGIGDTRASYRALGPLLAQAGYTVYVMDLRGHGDSDLGFPDYSSEAIGDDAVALLETLDLRDNELAALPSELGSMSTLRTLHIRGNPLPTETVPEPLRRLLSPDEGVG